MNRFGVGRREAFFTLRQVERPASSLAHALQSNWQTSRDLLTRQGPDALPLKSPRARREAEAGVDPSEASQRRARAFE